MGWRLKSPASRLFTQPFILAQIKVNIKASRHWPLYGEFTGTGEFPTQMASNAENVSIWWRHHVFQYYFFCSLWILHVIGTASFVEFTIMLWSVRTVSQTNDELIIHYFLVALTWKIVMVTILYMPPPLPPTELSWLTCANLLHDFALGQKHNKLNFHEISIISS